MLQGNSFRLGLAIGMLALAAGTSAHAATLSFENITGNDAANAATGETQISLEVLDAGGDQVSFTFVNTGPELSSITDVYFDDGTLLGIALVDDSVPGVSFSQMASPPDLPGGNEIDPQFNVTVGFLADSDPPVQPNGVNPGESLTIVFDLQSGGTLADVLDELATGTLRVGIRVQGFADGGSESFVNAPLPEPSAWMLLAGGLGGLAALRSRHS